MDEGGDRPSKSERKRQALRAQALGRRLTELSTAELATVPLPEPLRDAVTAHGRMAKKEARRRQLQFIGRLMRDADEPAIQRAVDAVDHTSAQQKYRHRRLETWRDRLLEEPAAVTAYVAEHPGTDVQALRRLLRDHGHARDEDDARRLARKLYRFLASAEAAD